MSGRISIIVILAMSAMLCAPLKAGADPLEEALANPPATGLMVLEVADGSQGAEKGLAAGDIITTYGGLPISDEPSLRKAQLTLRDRSTIPVEVVRAAHVVSMSFAPASLGIGAAKSVTQGVRLELLPPDTGAVQDVSGADLPTDAWYSVSMDGKKVGYEHQSLARREEELTLKTELAFLSRNERNEIDPKHYVVTATMKGLKNPALVQSEYSLPHSYVNKGSFDPAGAGGKGAWLSVGSWRELIGGKPTPMSHQTTLAAPTRLTGDFGLEALAAYLPLEKGTCLHLTLINLGAGDLAEKGALKVNGVEEVDVAGQRVRATRIDYYTMGDITATIWVDDRRRVARFSRLFYSTYLLGGNLTDRAGALADVTADELQPVDH